MEVSLLHALSIALLIFGFGFVIFWHELGHFLAAKRVGIRVEQFAVGMGYAMCSWRKGIGFRWGSTQKEFLERAEALIKSRNGGVAKEKYSDKEIFDAADELKLGETEYRIAWFPIGGYVKPYGQDDLDMTQIVDDPRSYSAKTIGQRMQVISAGVIMNIILAGLLFMILFMMGFRAPAPVVGHVLAGSPAQLAGLTSGDTILDYNGARMDDFTKVKLSTALASGDEPAILRIRHADGTEATVSVQPVRPEGVSKAMLELGITPASSLQGVRQQDWPPAAASPDLENANFRLVQPGDVITQVNGQDVRPSTLFKPGEPGDYDKFVAAAQDSGGKPVVITIKRKDGHVDHASLEPEFLPGFDPFTPFNIAGMQPRMRVDHVVSTESPVYGKMKVGDVIKSIEVRSASVATSQPGDLASDVSVPGFIKTVGEAGEKNQSLDLVVLRDGQPVTIKDVRATMKVGKDRNNNWRKGVGIAPTFESQTPVVAAVVANSPAAVAKEGTIEPGSLVTMVDQAPVRNWFEVRDALMGKAGDHKLTLRDISGKQVARTISVSDKDVQALREIRIATGSMILAEEIVVRQTSNPLTALGWGVLETRDLILQFYVTLHRMFGGSIPASSMMGPVGIVGAGAMFAFKGNDWLIWFLAMISANLAVVNFLPIPIVDGGQFLFLIVEKLRGKPLSRRAQEIAQFAGLALILSVFVMVTFNDIQRILN